MIERQTRKGQTPPGMLYALPFAVTIAFIGYALQRGAIDDVSGDLAFTRDPTRLVVLGSAYALAFLLLISRPAKTLAMLGRHWVYALFLVFIGLSALWSAHPAKVIVDTGHYVGFSAVVLAATYYFHDKPLRLFRTVAAATSFVIAGSIVVAMAQPAIGIHSITGRWQGVTGNPNTLGLLCALALWSAVSLLVLEKGGLIRLACVATAALAFVGLAGAHSTTSIVISAFIVCAVPLFSGMEKGSAAIRLLKAVGFVTVALTGLLAVYALHPGWLTMDAALAAAGKDRSLTGRTELWEQGYALVLMKPWLGWSFDSLASVLSHSKMETGQFHNGYLDLAVRGGISALLFLIYMTMRLLMNLYRYASNEFRLAMCWLVLVIAILMHNVTEASLVRTTHAFWLMFLMGYLFVDYSLYETGRERRTQRLARLDMQPVPG